jgi:hypothetical protein
VTEKIKTVRRVLKQDDTSGTTYIIRYVLPNPSAQPELKEGVLQMLQE